MVELLESAPGTLPVDGMMKYNAPLRQFWGNWALVHPVPYVAAFTLYCHVNLW